MVTIIRYLLLGCVLLFIPYEYSQIRAIYLLRESYEKILIFEKYYATGGDHSESSEYMYAVGKINGLNSMVEVGFIPTYDTEYYADSLDNLEVGDTIKIWYNENTGGSFLRINGKSKQNEVQKRIEKNVTIISVYITLLIIFEYLFRKEWRNRKLESEF